MSNVDWQQKLEEMSNEMLQSLIEHDSLSDDFLQAHCSYRDGRTKQLVEEIQVQNLEISRSNVEAAKKIVKLKLDIDQLRNTLAVRQESLKPLAQKYASSHQSLTIAGLVGRLQKGVQESQAGFNSLPVNGESGEAELERQLNACVDSARVIHHRSALLEILNSQGAH